MTAAARCAACNITFPSGATILRTRRDTCYDFQGEPGDSRNGVRFHAANSVIVSGQAHVVQVAAKPDEPLPDVRREHS